jgi:hypothetical protein
MHQTILRIRCTDAQSVTFNQPTHVIRHALPVRRCLPLATSPFQIFNYNEWTSREAIEMTHSSPHE